MRVGPDIGKTSSPLVAISALGAVVINSQGFAADLDIDLGLNLSVIDLDVSARLLINTTGVTQAITLPDTIISRLQANEDAGNILAGNLLDRLGGSNNNQYSIDGRKPIIVGSDGIPKTNTINKLLNGGVLSASEYARTASPYVTAVLSGSVTFAGFAEAQISGGIGIDANSVELFADLSFSIGTQTSG